YSPGYPQLPQRALDPQVAHWHDLEPTERDLIGNRGAGDDGDTEAGGYRLLDRLGAADLQRAPGLNALGGQRLRHHLARSGSGLAHDQNLVAKRCAVDGALGRREAVLRI